MNFSVGTFNTRSLTRSEKHEKFAIDIESTKWSCVPYKRKIDLVSTVTSAKHIPTHMFRDRMQTLCKQITLWTVNGVIMNIDVLKVSTRVIVIQLTVQENIILLWKDWLQIFQRSSKNFPLKCIFCPIRKYFMI